MKINTKTEFLRIMAEQTEIALATSVNNVPNVRIVNFYFDPCENILYFSSFKDNDKVKEIEGNPSIAFTTIPHTGNQHVKAKGLAKRSSKTVVDMAEHFIAKVPDYKKTIDYAGELLILFEVRFDTAIVTKDLATISTLRL
nr:pyridoxamine 5'-phosphate oxidase family protein [Streptococcus salivarius]